MLECEGRRLAVLLVCGRDTYHQGSGNGKMMRMMSTYVMDKSNAGTKILSAFHAFMRAIRGIVNLDFVLSSGSIMLSRQMHTLLCRHCIVSNCAMSIYSSLSQVCPCAYCDVEFKSVL